MAVLPCLARLVLVVFGASLALADNPLRVALITSAKKQRAVDLHDISPSTYSEMDDSVNLLWDGSDSSKFDEKTDCYRKIGAGFQFKATETLHEVVMTLEGDGPDKWEDMTSTRIHFGANGGVADSAFGQTVYSSCLATDVFQDTNGIWLIRSIGTRTGRWLSIVGASGNCGCDRRRRQLSLAGSLSASNASAHQLAQSGPQSSDQFAQSGPQSSGQLAHGRLLGKNDGECSNTACAKIKLMEMRAYVYQCPGGTYPNNPTSKANGNCIDCPKGNWCPASVALGTPTASTYRKSCPRGTQGTGTRKATQASGCSDCPAGKFGATTAATSCTSCSSGSTCPIGSTSASNCPAGFYCSTPAASPVACIGAVCPVRSTSPSPCPSGSYCPDGISSPLCPAGKFCPASATTPTDCPAGSYCPAATVADIHCVNGDYCPARSAAAADCAQGYFCDGGGVQFPCPIGRFGSAKRLSSADSCTACPAGRFGSKTGQASANAGCSACPAGTDSGMLSLVCFPLLKQAVADDTGAVESGFSQADVLQLTFSGDTNEPDVSPRASSDHGVGVYASFVFWAVDGIGNVFCSSPDAQARQAVATAAGVSVGSIVTRTLLGGGVGQLSALWLTASRLRIDIVVVDAGLDTDLLTLGANRIFVFPAADRLAAAASQSTPTTTGPGIGDFHSIRATNQVPLTGTWGIQGSAALASATILGRGSAEGADPGDQIRLQFNQILAGMDLSTLAASTGGRGSGPAVVDLVPRGFTTASTAWTGWSGTARWMLAANDQLVDLPPEAANTSVIVITITAVDLLDQSAGNRTFGGLLAVRVRSQAGLQGAGVVGVLDRASNNVTAVGSWGETPSTPLFLSHSPGSAILTWREPHRPEGQLTVDQWATLGLDGFLVRWCDAGSIQTDLAPMAINPDSSSSSSSSSTATSGGLSLTALAASAVRWYLPVRSSNASGVTQLAQSGKCAAAFVPRPASDASLIAGLRLPLLSIESAVTVSQGRAVIITVAAVFNGVVGPAAAAVDASPGLQARTTLDPSDVVCLDGTAAMAQTAASLGLSSQTTSSVGLPTPECLPFALGLTAEQQRACRCVVAASGSIWGDVAGSAFVTPLPVTLHGVGLTATALSTPGGEFVILYGNGLPVRVAGMALTDDQEALFASELRKARAALVEQAVLFKHPNGLLATEVGPDGVLARSASSVPYTTATYGAVGSSASYQLRECTVVQDGTELQCLSAEGVGKAHLPNITVNGFSPGGPVTALSAVDGSMLVESGASAVAMVSYSAPYVQEFQLSTADDLLPTAGGVHVLLKGRHFGPVGSVHIETVTFSPARYPLISFSASNCTVSQAHVTIRCVAPPSAGQQSYWSARIAGQDSLLPATSVRAPSLQSLKIVTLEDLAADPPSSLETTRTSLINAAALVLGVPTAASSPNSTGTLADAVIAAASTIAAIPHSPSSPVTANTIPSSGGSLVWLTGTDLGENSKFLASVWMERAADGVTRQVFTQDVDAANSAQDTVDGGDAGGRQISPNCVVADPHTSILCVVPPGTGTVYSWRVQVLGANSLAAPHTTSYAALQIVALEPAELPTEGGVMTVEATNLPPLNDAYQLIITFNGNNITTATRDAGNPLQSFRFTTPPIVVAGSQAPAPGSNDTALAASAVLTIEAAGLSSSGDVPLTPPTIISLDADSSRRNEEASSQSNDDVLQPPPGAGGESSVLLEVYGSSFGGVHGALQLWVGETLCQTLTIPQIAAHLTLPTPYDPHTQYFCWTAQFSGQLRMQDQSQRITVSNLAYDYDAIKTPPAPLSAAVIVNATSGARAPSTSLNPLGGDLLLLDGLSMGSVTTVQLLLLAQPSGQGEPVSSRAVRFAAPCPVLPRAATIAAGYPDPCPTIEAPPSSPLCVSPRQVMCESTPGVGGAYFALAVAESSSKRLEGYSAAAVAGYEAPKSHALHPVVISTAGGDSLTIIGSGFGLSALPMTDDSSPNLLQQPAITIAGRSCQLLSRNSTVLTCLTPPGIALEAQVFVQVEGQDAEPLTIAYAAPEITFLRTFVTTTASPQMLEPVDSQAVSLPGSIAQLPTRGGWMLVTGSNFGPAPLVWLRDPVSLAQTACVVQSPSSAQSAVSSSHNHTWCLVAAGSQSVLSVVLVTSTDATLAREAVAAPAFGFNAPSITSVWFESGAAARALSGGVASVAPSQLRLTSDGTGLRPTLGGFLVHVVGQSFGLGATITIGGARCEAVGGYVAQDAPMGLGQVTRIGAAAGGLSPIIVAPATQPVVVLSADGDERVWSTHELVTCVAPQGSGQLQLGLTTATQRLAETAFRYDAPTVIGASPALVIAAGSITVPSRDLTLLGSNFGALAQATSSGRERLINVTARRILPAAQANIAATTSRSLTIHHRELQAGTTFGLRVSAQGELCTGLLMRAAHEELLCSAQALLPVGLLLIDVTVAQQTSEQRVILSLCPKGTTGSPGETCRPCPDGAECSGGFAEPQPLPGFFKQSASVFLACNPASACRGAESVLGRPLRPFETDALSLGTLKAGAILLPQAAEPLLLDAQQVIESPTLGEEGLTAVPNDIGSWDADIVATSMDLDVAFPVNGTMSLLLSQAQSESIAVLGDQCIDGYRSTRCAECSERFYRLEGRCEPCPELAWLMIPGFILALLCLLGVAQYLQKKNVQLAGLSVGVDMMQILSVFAALDLDWPIEIRNVFVTVKATSFSLEFLAPECSVKVAYADKFFGVAAIPVMLIAGSAAVALLQLCLALRRRLRASDKDAGATGCCCCGVSVCQRVPVTSGIQGASKTSDTTMLLVSPLKSVSTSSLAGNVAGAADSTLACSTMADGRNDSKVSPDPIRPSTVVRNALLQPPAAAAAAAAAAGTDSGSGKTDAVRAAVTAAAAASHAASVKDSLKRVLGASLDAMSKTTTASPLASVASRADSKATLGDMLLTRARSSKTLPSTRGLSRSPSSRAIGTKSSRSPSSRAIGTTSSRSPSSRAIGTKSSRSPSSRAIGTKSSRDGASALLAVLPTTPSLKRSQSARTASRKDALTAVKPSVDSDSTQDSATLDAVDAAIGLTLTLLFYSYLTATRNALQPLDCAMVDATDGSGSWEVIRLEPAVRCNRITDPTYAAVMPWAVITLLLYGLGIPVLFAILLFCNRKPIILDQKLLAKGEGFSQSSNPNFATRKRFGRLYADFKPEAFWWRLVLTTRKALVAAVSIMLTDNPTFAAAMTALILFVSFLLHNRYQPFLRVPAVSSEFLALANETEKAGPDKASAVSGGTPVKRNWCSTVTTASCLPEVVISCLRNSFPVLAVCLSSSKPQRKKRSHMAPRIASAMPTSQRSIGSFRDFANRALDAKVMVEAKQAAKVAVAAGLEFVFDYNTLEGSFLITGVLVLMGGLAFASNAMTVGSPAYIAIVAAVVTLVLSAILGFGWILGFELYRALRFASTLRKARAFQEHLQARAKRKRDTMSFQNHAPVNKLQALAKLAMKKPLANPLRVKKQ